MSKNKNNNKLHLTKGKLLTASALLFVFGLGTSAVATSAWYSMNDIASVGDLNLKINLEETAWLKLSLLKDGTKVEDSEGDGYTKEELGIGDHTLGEVSGMFESDWYTGKDSYHEGMLPKFHSRYRPGVSRQNSGLLENNLTDVGGYYVQNEFIFESGSDMDIYLTSDSGVEPNVELNQEVAFRKGLDVDKLNKVTNAVRISFLSEDGYIICDPGNQDDTYFGGVLDLNKDGYYDSDENDNEILYGEWKWNGESVDELYSPVKVEDVASEEVIDDYINNMNTFVASHQLGKNKVNIDSEKLQIKKESKYDIKSLQFDADDPLKKVTPICHLKANEEKRIVLSIYVEGWDRDMTDEIASASFNINVSFTGLLKY